ncbi:glycosyltransferase family 2 protein [Candidatus Woesebacteria bacterium]|nr:glycosyltransferase family 2 protein [Candidatus Woesebacteria bacterium]
MSQSKCRLSVIIVSFNTQALTMQAVDSVVRDIEQSPLLKEASEIIVVDNNSTDDSVQQLQLFSQTSPVPLKIIHNATNTGFANANNQAMQKAQGDFFLLLNSDTKVHTGALETLVSYADAQFLISDSLTESHAGALDTVGIVAATLHNTDGSIQPQGGSLPSLAALICHMWMLDDLPWIGKLLPSTQHTGLRTGTAPTEPYQIGWVGGTALLIGKNVVAEIGPLDDKIFMYCEDIEWCMRAHAHHYDVIIHPDAHVTHFQNKSGSPEKALKGEFMGYRYIWAKHKPLWQQKIAVFVLKSGALVRKFLFKLLGDTHRSQIYSTIAQNIQ